MHFEIEALSFDNQHDAVAWARSRPGSRAITYDERFLVVTERDFERLVTLGVAFSILDNPDGSPAES